MSVDSSFPCQPTRVIDGNGVIPVDVVAHVEPVALPKGGAGEGADLSCIEVISQGIILEPML